MEEGKTYYEMAFSENDDEKATEYAKLAVKLLKEKSKGDGDVCLMLADLYYYFQVEDDLERQLKMGSKFIKDALINFLKSGQIEKLKDVSSVSLLYYVLLEDISLLDVAKSCLILYTTNNVLDFEAFEMLGDCYKYSGELQRAESHYKLALKIKQFKLKSDETNKLDDLKDYEVKILNKLAELKESENKLDEAEKYYSEALKLNPKNYKALVQLARIKKRKGQLDEAIELYKLLSKIYPKNHHPLLDLAEIYYTMATGTETIPRPIYRGKLKKAIKYLTEACKRSPNSFSIQEFLALCYFLLGDYDKAKEYGERANKLRSSGAREQ